MLIASTTFSFISDGLVQINRLEEIVGDAVGLAARDLSCVDDIVNSGLWAWQHVPSSVFRWAWTSRGGLLFALLFYMLFLDFCLHFAGCNLLTVLASASSRQLNISS
jgi:hypothetical protein